MCQAASDVVISEETKQGEARAQISKLDRCIYIYIYIY